MNKLSIQSLNALFTQLNEQPSSVLWIRNKNYEQQLYVNSNYESIWEQDSQELYQNPVSFQKSVLPCDLKRLMTNVGQNINGQLADSNTSLYRIVTPSGETRFIKDWHYLLTDQGGKLIGFAGIAQAVSQLQWETELHHQQNHNAINNQQNMFTKHIFDILYKEFQLNMTKKSRQSLSDKKNTNTIRIIDNGKIVDLTPRETEVLYFLYSGKSAKDTAELMKLSKRTVEFHLENIKSKAFCRTKLELLSKIEEMN